MKVFRCRDKQCNEPIAFVNGKQEIECPKCRKRHKVYSVAKGPRFKMAAR
jgi:hypothetical protein